MDPPVVPADRLAGWRRVAETTERPFAAGPVSVTARTVRYEPDDDVEPSPFFFASRLRIEPSVSPNAALTRLVENRAREGFREKLADRDVEGVTHEADREIAVEDPLASTATLSTFRGRCTVAGESVPVEALLGVWEAGEYLLAGGAYPLTGEPSRERDGGREAARRLRGLVRGVRLP